MSTIEQPSSLEQPAVNGANGHIKQEVSALDIDRWTGFIPPKQIHISHPWLSRYYDSTILHNAIGAENIITTDKEIYGNPSHPIAFRIGNGGAGYTHVLDLLCTTFIQNRGNDFRIAWVANHTRLTQVALLADIVQVALTYEPEIEELTVKEGWCRRVCAPAFWDHFVIVGPKTNPAGLPPGVEPSMAMRRIVEKRALFHTRGDGSATYTKEQSLWEEASVDASTISADLLQTHALPPYQALEQAEKDNAYLLTDRATFLAAKEGGTIPGLTVYVEGGEGLLNPCSALINTRVPNSPEQRLGVSFAQWMGQEQAQTIVKGYGKDWKAQMPLFTAIGREEFGEGEKLAGRDL